MATHPSVTQPNETTRSNVRVGVLAFMGAVFMLGLGYASVPLYRLFCQVTGFGGTTQVASDAEAARAAVNATGQKISIRFDASTSSDMPWKFRPSQATDTITIGERDIAIYVARNESSRSVTGMATFNVTPVQAGQYFNKIQCFCFTEQTLAPGQEVIMPVLYYVDPAMLDDPNMQGVEQITLSYTFHRTDDPVTPASARTN